VAVVPALQRIEDEVERIVESETDGLQMPGVLEAPGLTVDRLRAFADAAGRCRSREIWFDIGQDDLVLVEEPAPPAGMAAFVADEGHGAPSLRFYSSREEFERETEERDDEDDDLEDAEIGDEGAVDDIDDVEDAAGLDEEDLDEEPWTLEFVRLDELPVRDVSAWADLGLSVSAADGYPVALKHTGFRKIIRPDAARLAFLEGVLRALADTSEADIDSGRWSRTLATADGEVTYRLAMPSLLDEASGGDPNRRQNERAAALLSQFLEEGKFDTLEDALAELKRRGRPEYVEPGTPEQKAQELVHVATGASGRRRVQLLREAISRWPDCFRAYLGLAEDEARPARALALFKEGLAAAERALGRERLDGLRGRYWDDRAARFCLRLRMGLAMTLRKLGRPDEAAANLQGVLELDENDHAGARDYLLALLLEGGRDVDAGALLARFQDGGAAWRYGAALLAFRQGDTRRAAGLLLDAWQFSPMSAEFLVEGLLGAERAAGLGPDEDDATHEDEDEAEECVDLIERAWAATPGAAEWMASELRRARHRRLSKRRRRARRR
jgi:hypothetical protein